MSGVSNTQLRKAFGVLKDSTKVGLAKVNSDYKELDVAIVKATNHVEHMAKEKHIRTILDATLASRPRADVTYCVHALARRLGKTQNWAVALKTLIVIHRALREADTTFREEFMSFRSRVRILNVSHFKDDSSPNAWDYSAWVRSYALFLEERLECFRLLTYDVEAEKTKTRELKTIDLLEQLPALQQLLFRLLACKPEGAAISNNLIQYALSLVAGESINLYAAINDGTLNLVDKFFEMQQHDAVKALEIYKKAGNQAEMLLEFYEICRGLEFLRGQKFTKIEQPPSSFAAAMEEYVREAARASPLPKNLVTEDRVMTPKAFKAIEDKNSSIIPEQPQPSLPLPEPSKSEPSGHPAPAPAPAPLPLTDDFLGLNEISQEASELDAKNSLALAVATEKQPTTTSGLDTAEGAAGWELALVGAPSSNGSIVAESKLAGGLDKLTLDCLYNSAMTRVTNQNIAYNTGQMVPNPAETAQYTQDPFYASQNIAPPANVQMAAMTQQQAAMVMGGQGALNPFGDPYAGTGFQPCQPQNPYTGFL